MNKKNLGISLIAVMAFLFTAALYGQTDDTDPGQLFQDVFERVRALYVDEISDLEIVEKAIDGMLNNLDAHSGYLDAKAYKNMIEDTKGEFGGLGIVVTMQDGFVKVVSPIDDTPAYRAGVKSGDMIIKLNGDGVQGMSLEEAVDIMKGKPGTDITITIKRKNKAAFDVEITRAIIKIKPVKWSVEKNNFGYVRITSFNENTYSEMEKAIKDIKSKTDGKLRGLVLDLRNNPGGLLDQAINVSDAFLNKGEIVSTKGRTKEMESHYYAKPGDLMNGLPIVVLINSGSASASEIVAGALQDHKRAIIMGTQSFGKGSVQTIMPLSNKGAIKLTIARYYTPSGDSIQGIGITPEIIVQQAELKEIDDKGFREADYAKSLDAEQDNNKNNAANDNDPSDEEAADYQKDRALDLLRGLSLYER